MTVDLDAVESLVQQLLVELGEDPDSESLRGTPARVARFWKEFLEYDPGNVDTGFQQVKADQMVAVTGMRVWSICEHHLLPFWCDVSVGYVTGGKVLGLSKFARIAHDHSHRLQIQERLVEGIAEDVRRLCETEDVIVVARGVHTCMVMRGIRTEGTMTSSSLNGVFKDSPEARAEFMSLMAMDS